MKTHSIPRGNSKHNAETYTERQSNHGRIIVPSQVMGDNHSRPDSDTNDNCGNYRTNDAGDDNIMSPARHMVGKVGRHSTIWCWGGVVEAQKQRIPSSACERENSSSKAEISASAVP